MFPSSKSLKNCFKMQKNLYKKCKHKMYILFLFCFSVAFSQNIQDLQKIQREFDKISRENNQNPLRGDNLIDSQSLDPRLVQIPINLNSSSDSSFNTSKFFGYNFFANKDTISFWQNLPIPNDYILGPGDELVVSLWGETQIRKSYIISKDGKIFDDKIGILFLADKNINEVKLYLKNQFSAKYSTLSGLNPSTFIDISLGKLKSINVTFVGQVKNPGQYPIHSFSNLSTGLMQVGGIDTTGSLRLVKIIRNNKTLVEVDFYNLLLDGVLPEKIQLMDNDIVLVPFRLSSITIDSAVHKPGIYESLPEESAYKLIKYAGGLLSTSSNKIEIKRTNRNLGSYTSKYFYINYDKSKNFKVKDGDKILIRPILKTRRTVEIIGRVKSPGKYGFFEGMSLSDLFSLAGGLRDSTFLKSIYKDQGEIIRRNTNARYETVIPFDLNPDGINKFSSILLQNFDRIVVHSNSNYFERKNIYVGGEVLVPGSYPLISDNENLDSILSRAGGLTTKALIGGVSIFRDKLYFDEIKEEEQNSNQMNIMDSNEEDIVNASKIRVAWKSKNLPLMPGDSVVVRRSTGTINIIGEVYNPGLVEYKKGKKVSYYLDSAGGITKNGDKQAVIIVLSNGIVIPKRWNNSPSVPEGSTIVIKQKQYSEPFNITQFATSWTSILSSLITVFVLSQQLQS